MKTLLSDGTRTETFVVDYVDRSPDRRDAVAVIAYEPADEVLDTVVLLREQVRYPAQVVTGHATLIEVVAGIIEGDEGAETAALRELQEEAGLTVPTARARRVGGQFFASPGIVTERMTVVAVQLDPGALDRPLAPPGDGSAMEEGAALLSVSLGDALLLTDRGGTDEELQIADAKTELALFRLKRMLEGAK